MKLKNDKTNLEYENNLFEKAVKNLKISYDRLDNDETFQNVFKEMERLRKEDASK